MLDKTIEYGYNGIGNIASVTKNGVTTTFGYDTNNPDRLISYNGKTIGYDTMGRVSSYDGYSYSWANGKLSRRFKGNIRTGSTNYSYSYNANGQRIGAGYSRTLGTGGLNSIQTGEIMRYSKVFHYDNMGRLVAESNTKELYMSEIVPEKIVYLYDENTVIGMVHTEYGETNTYYFLRNLLGDVIGIYDTNGNKVVGYSYDAWGNCTIDSTTTNYPLAHTNPIRYRGYYYDEDTNLYCLGARYYSPEWRRFISPDDTAYLDPESVNGLNLYCYCNNDPINFVDPSGHMPNWLKWLIGGATFAIATILTVATGGALTPVVIGMGASIVTGGVIEGAISAYNGEGFWNGFSNGAANGAMWGGIFALGGATLRTINIFKNGVVIGENMTRVKTAASQLGGAQTYAGMPGFKLVKMIKGETYAVTQALSHNKAWLTRMMNWGVKVYDIGIDVKRTIGRSPFYAMENALVNGYLNMIPCYLI